MLKKISLSAVVALALLTFGIPSAVAQKTAANDGKHFGAYTTPNGAVEYAKLSKKMGKADSLAIKVSGTVKEVCQVKGCWMTLTAPNQPDMRVTFKDYAFFMPKDLSGKKVVVDGYAYVKVTPVDELRHYAEDAGKSQKEIQAITEPKREIVYEAKGVVIL
ncbi:MAG: DUF4920 domain-containing protein [Saprospiraceae bacterium]|nr:DUF4920 domain-containing protein [Saprospiraceae bacterium]